MNTLIHLEIQQQLNNGGSLNIMPSVYFNSIRKFVQIRIGTLMVKFLI